MSDIDQVLDRYRPVTRSVPICLDGQLLADIDEAEEALEQAQEDRDKDAVEQLRGRLKELAERRRDATTTFVFRAIGQGNWRALHGEHPLTEEEEEAEVGEFSDDFIREAIAASCVAPEGVDREAVDRMFERFNWAQLQRLWAGCQAANIGSDSIPFSAAASALLRPSEPNSTT